MLEESLFKVIPLVALPQVAAMLVDGLYNMADMFFVSQLGLAATAAVGINDSLMHLIHAIALTFGMGAASYISRLMGAKKDEEASRAASTTLFSAMGSIAIIAIGLFIFVSPLVDFLGATEAAKRYSTEYARWTLLFSPFTAGTVCLSQTLRGEGSSARAMIGTVSGCIINIALDPLLITTFGLGVAGAAIATGISKVISFGILLYPYLAHKSVLRINIKLFLPSKSLYVEIARIGIPVALRSGMMVLSSILINNLASGFGDDALASVSVANKCMRLIGSGIIGFGQGFQPIAGFCWGAKKYGRVKKAFYYTSLIGAVLGALLGALLAIFANEAIGVFADGADSLSIGTVLIRTQCAVLPLHVLSMTCTGLLQATGKAVRAGVMALSRQVIILIPCALLLTYRFGLDGLSYSQAVADVISALAAVALTYPLIKELDRMQRMQETTAQMSEDEPGENSCFIAEEVLYEQPD